MVHMRNGTSESTTLPIDAIWFIATSKAGTFIIRQTRVARFGIIILKLLDR